MDERNLLAERFEAQRNVLRGLALRMLGSASDADDAIQEAWLRLERVAASDLENLTAWLRTVVTRICLDMLRSRRSRREQPPELLEGEPRSELTDTCPQEAEVLLAESLTRAMLLVLETLQPAERVAFVLHDVFALPFEEIGRTLDRTPTAAKKLASRARQKVQGAAAPDPCELAQHQQLVAAFLRAARAGDVQAVSRLLAPDVVRRADAAALPPGAAVELRGADAVARGVVELSRRSQLAQLALVDGGLGAVVAPDGRLRFAVVFGIAQGLIADYEVIADPERLRRLRVVVLPT